MSAKTNMLVLRTSNFQGADFRPIVPWNKHSFVFIYEFLIATRASIIVSSRQSRHFVPYLGIFVFILPRGKTHVTDESDGIEEALDITGEDVSEGHVGKENRLLNAYGPPVVVRGQNENRSAARREEDVSEPHSIVIRVGRNFNFSFILKCMLLFARFFPFQFLTKTLTRMNYRRRAAVKQRVKWGWLTYTTSTVRNICTVCRSLFGHSTFFVASLVFYKGHFVLCY